MDQLEHAGQVALNACLWQWGQRVVDPPYRTWREPVWDKSREAIDGFIRGDLGLGWSRCSLATKEYSHDGDFEWCGAFAAHGWRCAGLDPVLADVYWSSTYRLDKYGRRGLAFGSLREIKLRRRLWGADRKYLKMTPETELDAVLTWGPRAGDILLVDTSGTWRSKWPYGHHVTMIERVEDDVAYTVEGNATGRGPDGTIYQGVIKAQRKYNTWRRFIRPGLTDLTDINPMRSPWPAS